MYDRILVPTDGSAGVERAVEHAAGLAAAHGADLHAVYVVNTASFASLPVETSWEGVDGMLREEGREALARVEDLAADHGVDVAGVVREGRPAREIVRYAEDGGCDLVVMATHGRGGIDRLLLGSVTEHVVRASSVPVLTVRIGDEPDSRGDDAVEDADAVGETDDAVETADDQDRAKEADAGAPAE